MKLRYLIITLSLLILLVVSGIGFSRWWSSGSVYLLKRPAPFYQQFGRGDIDDEYLSWLRLARGEYPPSSDNRDNFANKIMALAMLENFDRHHLSAPNIGIAELDELVNREYRRDQPNEIFPLAMQLCKHYNAFGDFTRAKKIGEKMGLVTEWLIAGTFGKFDRASFFEILPPEKEINFTTPMAGKNGEVQWQKIPLINAPLKPYQWLEDDHGIIYLFTQFEVKEDTHILGVFSIDGEWRGWFDGVEFTSARNAFAYENPLNNLFDKPVKSGWHNLLLKIYPRNKESEIAISLRDVQETISYNYNLDEQFSCDASGASNDYKLPAQIAPLVRERIIGDDPLAQAIYSTANKMPETALHYYQEEIGNHDAFTWNLRAAVEMNAPFLPTAKRESLAYQSYKMALQHNPQNVTALIALGEYERTKKRYRAAHEFFAQALSVNPRSLPALSAMAQLPISQNWHDGEKYLSKLEELYPQSYSAIFLRAQYAENRRDFRTLFTQLQKLIAFDQTNLSHYVDLAQTALLTDQAKTALAEIVKMPEYLRRTPMIINLTGQLLSALQQHETAENVFATRSENSANFSANVGQQRLLQNKISGAIMAFDHSLRLQPAQHNLRQLRYDLADENYAFWETTAMSVPDAIKSFEKRTPPSGKTARLIDQTTLQLYPDNSFVNYTHELQAVLNDSGVKSASQIERVGELLSAQTILPERGLSLEPILLDETKEILMPAVTTGAFVEHQYLQRQNARIMLRFPQWYFRSPNTEEAFMHSQYIVRVPPNTPFAYTTRNFGANIEFNETTEKDGTKVYHWSAKDMERALHEEGGLSIDETLPFVKISSDNSWQEINLLFANYYLGKIPASRSLDNVVHRTLMDLPNATRAQKAQVLMNAVGERVENTGFNAPALYIWEQRAGDRNLPLMALLKIAGLNPRLAAVRPAKNLFYEPVWELPSAEVFTHFLLVIDDEAGNKIWLDTHSRFAQVGEITEDIAGGTAMIIDPQNPAEFITLPPPSPESYTNHETRTYKFNASNEKTINGEIVVTGEKTLHGYRALELKEIFAEESKNEKQKRIIEEILRDGLPAIALQNFTLPTSPTVTGAKFSVNYQAQLSGMLRERIGDVQGMPLGLPPLPLLPREDFTNRKTAYHLSQYLAENNVYTFCLPPSAKVQNLPPSIILRNVFGAYQLTFKEIAGGVEVRRTAHFSPQRIPSHQWKSFYEFARQITTYENQVIWWQNHDEQK